MPIRSHLLVMIALLLGCGESHVEPRVEGTEVGDCNDGADNDADGAFDCADASCEGAPVCAVTLFDAGHPVDAGAMDAGTDHDAGPITTDAGRTDAGVDAGTSATDAGMDDASTPPGTVFPERDFVCAPGDPQPCALSRPLRSDGERTALEPHSLPGTTLTYVISALSMPEALGGFAAGFDRDGLDSGEGSNAADADCEEFAPDYESVQDPGHVGVDNVYQTLIPTVESFLDTATCPGGVTDGCLDAMIARQIAAGDLLVLVELRGVDDLVYDSSITVQLYAGAVPGGGTPALSADGRLAPGQRFDAVPMGAAVAGDIFAGRVRATVETLSLPLSADAIWPLLVRRAELRFNFVSGGLSDGQIGGHLLVDDLVAAVAATDPSLEGTVRSVLEGYADIGPTSDPFICSGVSIGMMFGATTATR